MQTTALAWVAFDLTRQSMGPALVTVAQVLPTFLLGAWGGSLADRWPKRSLLLWTQSALLVLALLLALFVWAGLDSVWMLLLLTAMSGVVGAIDLPARLAFVMEMVGREDLINAVALNSVLFNVARAVGPALAGWLLVGLGPESCFLINGLSYAAVVWALWRMEVTPRPVPRSSGPRRPAFLYGFGYLAGQPALALLVILAGLLCLSGWPFQSLLPALAEHTLNAGAVGYSWMLSGTGFGALSAALTVARYGSLRRGRLFLATGVGLLSGGLIGLSSAPGLPLAVVCCALTGFGLILFFATSQSLVQLGAGDHNRGRVMGIWAMVVGGALPLGNLLAFPAADRWGPPEVLRFEGLVSGAAGLIVLFVLQTWSRLRTQPVESS
jgi:MFS family permease